MRITIIFSVILALTHINNNATLRIVLGTALTTAHFEFRKQQYIDMFARLKGYGYDTFYVVEGFKKEGPTFLDEYAPHVFYAQTSNPDLKNQGVNEARTQLEGTYHFMFDPDDMILKLTGRYHLLSDDFLRCVEQNADNFDAFVQINENGDVYTLGFAMRCKYFQEMYEQINYTAMEKNRINLETEVGNYIKRKLKDGSFRVFYITKLHIMANLFGSSAAPNAQGILYY